jgi:hypothetical protein
VGHCKDDASSRVSSSCYTGAKICQGRILLDAILHIVPLIYDSPSQIEARSDGKVTAMSLMSRMDPVNARSAWEFPILLQTLHLRVWPASLDISIVVISAAGMPSRRLKRGMNGRRLYGAKHPSGQGHTPAHLSNQNGQVPSLSLDASHRFMWVL